MNASRLLMLLRRLAAFLYDSLLLFALFFFITGVAISFNQGRAIESAIYQLALIPVAGLFFFWFWNKGGQTLGMRAWRIKLVNNDGSDADGFACLKRVLSGTLFFGLTYLYALINNRGDTLHDRLSSTRIERIQNH